MIKKETDKRLLYLYDLINTNEWAKKEVEEVIDSLQDDLNKKVALESVLEDDNAIFKQQLKTIRDLYQENEKLKENKNDK